MDFRNWYNNRAKTYTKKDPQGELRYKIALQSNPVRRKDSVLDIGCKTLSLLHILEEREIPCNYNGLDISQIAKKSLNFKVNKEPKIIIKDAMKGLPFKKESFDRIFCLEVIEHVHTPIFLLDEIKRVLKKDGKAVVSCPNPYYWINMLNTLFNTKENEGHISCFRDQEISTMCDFVDLKIVKKRTTFSTFPPMKSKKHFYLKTFIPLASESIQYTLERKSR